MRPQRRGNEENASPRPPYRAASSILAEMRNGSYTPSPPQTSASRMEALRDLWAGGVSKLWRRGRLRCAAGLRIFDDFWRINLKGAMLGAAIAAMAPGDVDNLKERVCRLTSRYWIFDIVQIPPYRRRLIVLWLTFCGSVNAKFPALDHAIVADDPCDRTASREVEQGTVTSVPCRRVAPMRITQYRSCRTRSRT